jgi:hypothetical protein
MITRPAPIGRKVSTGRSRGPGRGMAGGGMNLLRLLVNQMRRRSTDQSNPHSARSADVSRRRARLPDVRGAKDRHCLHAGSKIARSSAKASRWDSAMWKVGFDLPGRRRIGTIGPIGSAGSEDQADRGKRPMCRRHRSKRPVPEYPAPNGSSRRDFGADRGSGESANDQSRGGLKRRCPYQFCARGHGRDRAAQNHPIGSRL